MGTTCSCVKVKSIKDPKKVVRAECEHLHENFKSNRK